MQPNRSATSNIWRIANKEVTLFFASPIAYLFLATFAAVTLFVFFWGEAFFARNIADVRPLFEWMPLLLIFLASTLTMRLWSEERRTGTLEHVLTQPVPLWHFVVGKFVGCLVLLSVALIITLPLPITVSVIADLDWGPVWAGYLATFLLGATYLSIGLFVSARSNNQIVSLISAVALCGVFYLVGSPAITDFFGNTTGEWLRTLGTGSRFDAITRGMIDLRDLYYYLSLIAVFLSLNTFSLERERWAAGKGRTGHQLWRAVTLLLVANALGANLWLGQISALRVDTTEGNQYSISDATQQYLDRLQEPLLLRGYFSSKTHPLLSPLVPQLRDLMREYEVAGNGRVRVEIVDPVKNPELEKEANQKYGIEPVPFQVADRHQSSIVSSYFNVVVQYGDEHEVLSFRDLIEVKADDATNIDVRLRNPEYDLTSAIKKVLRSWQAGGNLFDTVQGDLTFKAYVSDAGKLPKPLTDFREQMNTVLNEFKQDSGGQLQVQFINPQAGDGQIAQRIAEEYGFQPMATNLFSNDSFYFYLTLTQGDQVVQIPLGDMSETRFRQNLEAGIKRFASGFTKTVALVTPPGGGYGPYGAGGPQFSQLQNFLGADLNVQSEDLSDGSVSGDADILLLAAPKNLGEKALFAVDQFLMQGGTIVAATSPYSANISNRSLSLQEQTSGLSDWLAHHGLKIGDSVVMDSKNSAFPVPVTRNLGGFQVQEMRMLDYPYFVDLRGDRLNQENMITSDLQQLTMAWASPIEIDQAKQGDRKITELMHSSPESWLSTSTNVMPRIGPNGAVPFTPEGETGPRLLGVISEGRFDSFFAGKESPLLAQAPDKDSEEAATEDSAATEEPADITVSSVIQRSPDSARIVLFSSNDFLRDQVMSMAAAGSRTQYLGNLQLLANTVDWSLEDTALLSIRARGHFNRTLPPLERSTQLFWEYLNYGLAALALVLIALAQRQRKKSRERVYLQQFAN